MSEATVHWEDVPDTSGHSGYLKRARVTGGWLYRMVEDFPVEREGQLHYGLAWTSSICFVPDRERQ